MSASNAPPALAVYANGVGAVSDANLNSFMQAGAHAADLRNFKGLNRMVVWVIGIVDQSDGGAGAFVFNSQSTAADDDMNVIAPFGSLQGRWIRQSGAGLMLLFPTIAALRASTAAPPASPVVFVEGYYTGADGGEGLFWFNPTDTTSADNGGTLIVDAAGNRWVRERNKENYNIHWFGVQGDVAPTLTAAFAALVSETTNGGRIEFKQAKYTFESTVTLTYPAVKPFSLSLVGSGQSATTLYWPTTDGLVFNLADPSHTIHVRDMSITTGATATRVGINVNQVVLLGTCVGSDFKDLTFSGDAAAAAASFWLIGIEIVGLSFVDYDNITVNGSLNAGGQGISIAGNAALTNQYSVVHNLTNCSFNGLANGLVYGDFVQGVTVNGANFDSNATGTAHILVLQGAAGIAGQLSVINSQFGGTAGNPITIASEIGDLHLSNNLIFIPAGSAGLLVTTTGGIFNSSITGTTFSGVGSGEGVLVQNNGTSGSSFGTPIVGNTFSNLGTGVSLGTGTTTFNVQANSYPNTATKVTDNGVLNNVGTASP